MGFNMIVLVKQVPDTKNVTGDAMKPDGTVNRAALPAIFNPEDLNALEEALKIKEQYGGHITVITMGPQSATAVLKEALYRGADDVVLLSDRKFAGADTLATSYVLSLAIKKIGTFDLIFCGRQAIDGDTAQVGPQTAEKLGVDQITCVDRIESLTKSKIVAERSVDGGYEIIEGKLPILLTITNEANTPRPPSAKKVLAFRNILTDLDTKDYDEEYMNTGRTGRKNYRIKVWDHHEIGAELEKCGLAGSPTKVKKVDSVVLEAGDSMKIEHSKEALKPIIQELMDEHIIG
ncbi:MAG: electron transfer flavoprotein subunit beta/FixA family protein [Calditrichia bacterium]